MLFVLLDPRHRHPGKTQFLQAGAHEYSFEYTLPSTLPSSFESEDSQFKGRVHYLLRAKLDSPVDVLRETKDKVFIVLSSLDLNKCDRLAVSSLTRVSITLSLEYTQSYSGASFCIFKHLYMYSPKVALTYI